MEATQRGEEEWKSNVRQFGKFEYHWAEHWAERKSANHEETRSKMYDIRRKGKWNRVNGTGNYTHWLFENSMRFQWSCIKMEIHRCISGLIEQQSRGGGWALRWRHVTVWRKRDRRQDQGLINWSREDRTQWKGETWGKGRAERLEMGIKGVDAGSTGRDNDPGGLGDLPDSQGPNMAQSQ